MPRKARIDAPGAVHHVICRGIAKSKIFIAAKDRLSFLKRLDKIFTDANTPCYAWVLMHNHLHLLLRTCLVPIATVMRRLLTRYAIYHNRRHHRQGHLFQNRYKSILCRENTYFNYQHSSTNRLGTKLILLPMPEGLKPCKGQNS
jgi:putative transposase